MNIVNVINSLSGVITLPPIDKSEIAQAEEILGITFPIEFVEYSKAFGCVTSDEIELFGLTQHKRLSVVYNTLLMRQNVESFPSDVYVVEDLGIECMVTVQSSQGIIYKYSPAGLDRVADSLADYLLQKKAKP